MPVMITKIQKGFSMVFNEFQYKNIQGANKSPADRVDTAKKATEAD